MSHEISMTRDGKAAAFYARKPAWHRLGEVTVSELTAKEALRAANLGFDVESSVAGAMVTVNGVEQFVPYPTMKMNYKVDTDDDGNGIVVPVGLVGNTRENLQPTELFDFMDLLVGDVGGAHYCAAFALREFKQIVAVLDMGTITLDAEGRADVIDRYWHGRTSWDASWQFGVKADNIRAECANMMAIHMRKVSPEFTTRHTTNLKARMNEARQALGLYQTYTEEFADRAEALIEAEIKMDQAVKFIDGLFVNYGKKVETAKKGSWSEDDKDTDAITQARVNYEFSPINDRVRGTVWGALNAATEYADWFVPARGGKKTTEAEALLLRQMGDTKAKYGNDFKEFAWAYAEDFAESVKTKAVAV